MQSTEPRQDTNRLLGNLGDAAFAWLAFGRDFWARTLGVGARHLEEGLRQGAALFTGNATNRVDALLERYQRYIGELGLGGLLAAQTFRRKLDEGKGQRLLFRMQSSKFTPGTVLFTDQLAPYAQRIDDLRNALPELQKELCGNGGTIDLDKLAKLLDGVDAKPAPELHELLWALGPQGASGVELLEALQRLKRALDDRDKIKAMFPAPRALPEQTQTVLDFLTELKWQLDDDFAALKLRWQARLSVDVPALETLFDRQALGALRKALWDDAHTLAHLRPLLDCMNQAQSLDERSLASRVRSFEYFDSSLELAPSLAKLLELHFGEHGKNLVDLSAWLEGIRRTLASGSGYAADLLDALDALRRFCGDTPPEALQEPTKLADEDADRIRREFADHGIKLSQRFLLIARRTQWTLTDQTETGACRRFVGLSVERKTPAATSPYSHIDVYGAAEGTTYGSTQLPMRVRDAHQGFALFSVDRASVQSYINGKGGLGSDFLAWDLGAGRTPLALFIVDYLDTDIGPYREFGVGCFVAPLDDQLALGMHILSLPVTESRSADIGRDIWGYPKFECNIEFDYTRAKSVSCRLSSGSASLLELTLPRDGDASSEAIPLNSYTNKKGLRYRTVFTRSGRGEALFSGGEVKVKFALTAPSGAESKEDSANTLKRKRELRQLLLMLRELEIEDSERLMFSGWTEHMSGEFGAPVAVSLPRARIFP